MGGGLATPASLVALATSLARDCSEVSTYYYPRPAWRRVAGTVERNGAWKLSDYRTVANRLQERVNCACADSHNVRHSGLATRYPASRSARDTRTTAQLLHRHVHLLAAGPNQHTDRTLREVLFCH